MEQAGRRFPVRWAGNGVLVVEVPEPFDDGAAAELCALLTRLAATGQRTFVVDLRAVDPSLAAGAGRFVEGVRAVTARGAVLAFVAGPAGRTALRAAGAGALSADVHDAVAAAVDSVASVEPVESLGGGARGADPASGPTPAQDSL
ncbi:STAS domain-containing protein [Streptomyces sp. NPDC049813]|uniref:STAS domain-containing protein n=1 Tax=Streptomyces sp. NPDC049813 TaxID=3365597 RepID=UPI0037B6CC93